MAASNSDESAAASWTASASFSGSSSTAVGAVKRTSSQADANCTCGASTTKRSCLACLNEMLLSGDECAINPYGTCVTKDEAERAQTALQNALSASRDVPGSLAIYASANASYCGSDDQVCSACRATWISEYELGSLGIATALGRGNGTALSCTGADGCVCLAYCELREIIESPSIRLDTSPPPSASAGWVAFRERLIEDEREQLELREDEQGEANKQTPTPTLSAAAPRIAVEIGEGFRPESPSQLHRQQPPAAPQ
uniref:Uncharacterized protein n=1 Tax=Globisporangium ultimum (strain ATCC 200006 / CBS 805.95 / DAOM BR144) TaxID=431595 RepID=K3X0P5_GLOUD